ncbi:MAG TPA: hypothetical protein P5279_03680 [Anaerohalosphaeraceae bacterium]|nr:hypothetical protein [Anaerohalosphaeraceae bacterium]HRT49570.1 hypothetical protein [Anaerohalosphaeraceae bacterium]HRT85495.1 hypothetical protein [Anaerohalosphaeraceae bacterium]
MAEYILVSIITAVWIILARTLFDHGCTLWHALRHRMAAARARQPPPAAQPAPPPVASLCPGFSCRMDLTSVPAGDEAQKAFVVTMCGRIRVPTPMHETLVQVLLADVTDGPDDARPVLCAAKHWQLDNSPAFCYRAPNGRIPATEYVLSDWAPVVTIPIDLLRFPRRGPRTLQCVTSLFSQQTGDEICCATALLEYDNHDLGYIDARENAEQAEILTVQLVVAVCSAASAPQESAITTIRQWIDARLGPQSGREDTRRYQQLTAVLDESVAACLSGRKLDIEAICSRLSDAATIVDIYDAMRLCLRAIGAAGAADRAQTALIGRIAQALHVDEQRFRAMAQKILPINLHKEKDLEFILGITADMDPEQGRRRLRDEYQKWNARVTHPDPAIQAQADQMLTLIAEARDRLFDSVGAANH